MSALLPATYLSSLLAIWRDNPVDDRLQALAQVKHVDKFSLLVNASQCWTAVPSKPSPTASRDLRNVFSGKAERLRGLREQEESA